jgi:hypothetical protein
MHYARRLIASENAPFNGQPAPQEKQRQFRGAILVYYFLD